MCCYRYGQFLPPFYKYPVIVFVGFNLIFSATILAVSESFYKLASAILPIGYKIFEDTLSKGVQTFDWNEEKHHQMEMYQCALVVLWALSALGIVICLLLIVPQFFDFNDKKGNPRHICFALPTVAKIMYFIMIIYLIALMAALLWADLSCPSAGSMFITKFTEAEKEEVFVSELEEKLQCSSDDDKEISDWKNCWKKVQMSFIRQSWLDLFIITFIGGNLVCLLLVPLLNRQLFPSEDEMEAEKSMMLN